MGGLFLGKRKDGRWVFGMWSGGISLTLAKGGMISFRPPWNRPLFSERNGINTRHLFRLWGWRLFVRRPAR